MPRAMVATKPEVGLLAKGQAIPLRGVRVEATIQEFCSRVTITQRYANDEAQPIESVYVFPLEESAAVSGFAALVDGVEVVGEVKERDEAFDRYDEALAEGHGAYLLDHERPDVFVASIGNLPPGKEVLVKLSYVSELTREGDDVRFVLPTTISPRYAPAEDRRGVGQPPAQRLNPPLQWQVPYGLALEVAIEMASAIRSVESPSHPISVEIDGASATVRLGERQTAMDRDFVLRIRPAAAEEPRAWLETTPQGESVAMMVFRPQLGEEPAPCEMVFLVDRSGSMQGSSIAEARNALDLSLRSLPEGSFFNIVGFGTGHKVLFSESVPYNEDNLATASRHVRELEADLGGTEILPALDSVLSAPPRPGLARQLFLLTDGQVTNTEAVIALVRRHAGTTRVFTFGIGAGASHHLVRGVARAGEGGSEHIAPGERIESKVLRQLKRALSPALTDVRVDWNGLRVRQAPYRIPPVFANGRVLVYGFLDEALAAGEREIRLQAKGPKSEVSFAVPLGGGRARAGNLVATLAARALLRDLEEGGSAFHDRGSLQERGGRDRVKEEAVRLGVKYGLASRWTSFVAVEKRDKPQEGQMELRRIPVALTRGWGGIREREVTATGGGYLPAMAMPLRAAAAITSVLSMDSFIDSCDFADTSLVDLGFDELVRLQRADGSWELSKDFAKAIASKLRKLERSLPDFTGEREDARRAWATALAIEWLAIHASEWSAELSLLELKAREWLKKCQAQPSNGEEWLLLAARFLQA